MRNVLKRVLKLIINCFYLIYSYKTSRRFKHYKNLIYSCWIRNTFAKCGKTILIQSPAYIRGGRFISIGEGFNSLERLRLECWDTFGDHRFTPVLSIGDNVTMNYNVHIGCINNIYIGNNVLFASNIFITDHQHGFIDGRDLNISPVDRSLTTKGPVIIEDNVWIGENVVIMPNVKIGKGSIIGANSVVTGSFPENSVLSGIPAKLMKTLTFVP